MEIQLQQQQFRLLKHQLGFTNGIMVGRVAMGGGLILLWRAELDVQIVSYSQGHIDSWISNWLPTSGCFFTGFYGHWNVTQRRHSWDLLRRIGNYHHLPWCTIGDFNELLFAHETSSVSGQPTSQLKAFRQLVEDLDLKELSMEGVSYTWTNKRRDTALVRAKLDRGFRNGAFFISQRNSYIQALPMHSSDHHALHLILVNPSPTHGVVRQKPLRMEP